VSWPHQNLPLSAKTSLPITISLHFSYLSCSSPVPILGQLIKAERKRAEGSPFPSQQQTSACLIVDQRRKKGRWSVRSSGFLRAVTPRSACPSLVRPSSLSPAIWSRGEEGETKKMICNETNLKRKKTENRYAWCVPFVLQVTAGEKEKKGGSQARSPRPLLFLAAARERTASGGRTWRRCAATVPATPECLPCNSKTVLGLFVNFKLFSVLFGLFWVHIFCKHVIMGVSKHSKKWGMCVFVFF